MIENQFQKDVNHIETLLKTLSSEQSAVKEEVVDILNQLLDKIRKDELIQTSENYLYRNIFNEAPIGILYYNEKGIITACNDSFVTLFNTSRDKVIGLPMKELPDVNIVHAVQKSLEGEKAEYEDYYTSVTSGKTVPIRMIFHPLKNPANHTVGGIGMIEDISERYAAREKLVASELRYRSIFENKHKVMLIIDPETGSIVDANPAAINYYGCPLEELKKMKISEINTLSAEEVKREMERAKRTKRNQFHFKHRLADGSVKDVEVSSGMIQVEGKILLYSIITDITEQIKAQKELMKFKLGIERSNNIVFITDPDGYFQYVNPSFEKVYGYSLNEISEKTPQDPEIRRAGRAVL